MISGATRSAGVIGSPIRHSLSPTIFNAAFAASGLDWAYLAFDVPPGAVAPAIEGVRALGLEGVSVTMPHKAAVIPALDGLDDDATALGAVNCVSRSGRDLIGHNTDGPGFVDALRIDEGMDVGQSSFVVVGAGGAARAVVHALGREGAAVTIVNRSPQRAEQALALAGRRARIGRLEDVGDCDVVVNATSVGMGAEPADRSPEVLPFDPDRLGEGQVVVDLIYHPAITPLLAAARARGLRAVNGIGMLIHQAARAFRVWTHEEPPLEAMSAATLAALVHTEQDRG